MTAGKIMRKATEIFLLLFASVHLLNIGVTGYSNIFDAKKLSFCLFTSLYLICALCSLYLFTTEEKRSLGLYLKSRISPAHICVILYLVFTLISGVISPYFPRTLLGISRFEGMFTIFCYCAIFFLVSLFPCRKKYIFTVFSVCVTVFAVICFIQLFGFNPLGLYPGGRNFYGAGIYYTTAFIGTIGNTNLSGAFICLALPLLITALFKSRDKHRLFLVIPTSLLFFTVLKMDVISTVIGVFGGLVLCLPALFGLSARKTVIYFSVMVLIILTCLSLLYFFPLSDGFMGEMSLILHGEMSDSFGSGRIRIWKNVLSEIPDSFVFGKGPDTMQAENFAPFERYYPAKGRVLRTTIDCAHNEFLNVLYHQGILGLISYLAFVFFTIKAWLKNLKDPLILALGTSLVCYLVQSFFTFSMCLTAPYFWICAGLIVGLSKENTEKV